ncbi:hypothetical protein GCM10027081_07580 [Cupriavidus yeoncheonensis]
MACSLAAVIASATGASAVPFSFEATRAAKTLQSMDDAAAIDAESAGGLTCVEAHPANVSATATPVNTSRYVLAAM